MKEIWHSLSSTIFWCINNLLVVYLTLWLTNYRENKKDKRRFNNRINCLYRELQMNSRYRGPFQSPLIIDCLKHLIHEEPILQDHPLLLDKVHNCLCTTAQLYSLHSNFSPKTWETTIMELHEYISNTYADILVTQKSKETLPIRFKSLFLRKSNKVCIK